MSFYLPFGPIDSRKAHLLIIMRTVEGDKPMASKSVMNKNRGRVFDRFFSKIHFRFHFLVLVLAGICPLVLCHKITTIWFVDELFSFHYVETRLKRDLYTQINNNLSRNTTIPKRKKHLPTAILQRTKCSIISIITPTVDSTFGYIWLFIVTKT